MGSSIQLRTIAALACAAFVAWAPCARADEPVRAAFEPGSGRNLLNYPPHRTADVRHMRLRIRIPDMNQRSLLASETLTVAPIAGELSTFSLNAALLQVAGCESPGRTCTCIRNEQEQTLTITLDPPLSRGQTADITINYRVTDPPEGLIWTPESPAYPGQAAQLHSQGEPESNRYWFAGHDSPNARCTTEILATVPRGYQAVSNGRLESVTKDPLEPFDTFHWVQDRSHPMYLVSLVVGKFDVVDVGTSKLPMPVYVPPGQAANARRTFERTPRMIDAIARLTSQPYPWAKYAQVGVRNFAWGGMENTSATTMYDTVALDRTAELDGDQDDLIVHELAHQWFGDLVTCKSWEHIWLNEGFATYTESLWEQSARGTSSNLHADDAAYQALLWGWAQGILNDDAGAAPFQPAMASKEYDSPDDVFDRASNPYPKGALVLHMLRQSLGDDAFFRGLADYLQRNKLSPVETFQFREAMERAGGVSLQRFFDQWVFRPGVPRITVKQSWDAASSSITLAFEQMQTIDGYNPAFDVRIPVWVRCRGTSEFRKLEARFDSRTCTLTEKLPADPDLVFIDPELATLAEYRVEADAATLAHQMLEGPTLIARLRAVRDAGRLGQDAAGSLADTLETIVRNDKAHRVLRAAAAEALAGLGSSDHLQRLLRADLPDARVRASVVQQAANAGVRVESSRSAIAGELVRIFRTDRSYAVRAAAVQGLADTRSPDAMTVIAEALETDSQHDQIRKAGIDGLASLDQPPGLEIALKRMAPGNSTAVRAAATAALGKLGHHDPDRAIKALGPLLDGREPKITLAAGKALAQLGGPRARTLLQDRVDANPSRYWRGKAKEWLQEMKPEPAQAKAD